MQTWVWLAVTLPGLASGVGRAVLATGAAQRGPGWGRAGARHYPPSTDSPLPSQSGLCMRSGRNAGTLKVSVGQYLALGLVPVLSLGMGLGCRVSPRLGTCWEQQGDSKGQKTNMAPGDGFIPLLSMAGSRNSIRDGSSAAPGSGGDPCDTVRDRWDTSRGWGQ